jgi:hypothetical protein
MTRSIKKKKKGNFGYAVFKRFAIPDLYLFTVTVKFKRIPLEMERKN